MRKVVLATTIILITAALFTSCSENQDKNTPTAPGLPADTTIAPWSRTYGTLADDYATAVTTNDDGHIFVLGDSYDNSGGSDVFVLCLDAHGDVVWQTVIDHSSNESGSAIFHNSNGSLLLVGTAFEPGTSHGQVFLARLDQSGVESSFELLTEPEGVMPVVNETLWYMPSEPYRPMSSVKAVRIPEGGFLFSGDGYYADDYHTGTRAAFAMRTDEAGNKMWLRYFVGTSCFKPDFHEEGTGSAHALSFDSSTGEASIAWYYMTHVGSNIHDCGEPQIYSEIQHLNQNGETVWKKAVAKECPVRSMIQLDPSQVALLTQCRPIVRNYELSTGESTTSEAAIPSNIFTRSAISLNSQIAVTGFTSPMGGLYWGLLMSDGTLVGDTILGASDRGSGNALAVAVTGHLIVAGNKFDADSSMQAFVLKVDPL